MVLCRSVKPQDKVQHLKEEVQLQYQKMQQLLEEDLGKTLEVLDKAHSKFCQENSAQALQLHQKQQEAKKLLSSIQMVFDKAEDIGFMKVTGLLLLLSIPHSLFLLYMVTFSLVLKCVCFLSW